MYLKAYEVSILDKPETVKTVIAPYRRKAERIYLEHINKYTAHLETTKIDCSVITCKAGIL